MSEVLQGLLQKRASLSAELRALDAGIAAYRRALLPTKSAAVQGQRHQTDNESGREEEAFPAC